MDQNLTKNTQDTTYVGVDLSNRNLDYRKNSGMHMQASSIILCGFEQPAQAILHESGTVGASEKSGHNFSFALHQGGLMDKITL